MKRHKVRVGPLRCECGHALSHHGHALAHRGNGRCSVRVSRPNDSYREDPCSCFGWEDGRNVVMVMA